MIERGPVRNGRPSQGVDDAAAGGLDARAIRLNAPRAIGATQATFAAAIGVPVKTVRNWEQGRRQPSGPARVLLALIDRRPLAVVDILRARPRAPAA
jgi:putative transcriptional regulator